MLQPVEPRLFPAGARAVPDRNAIRHAATAARIFVGMGPATSQL